MEDKYPVVVKATSRISGKTLNLARFTDRASADVWFKEWEPKERKHYVAVWIEE
jgi:hypothetical protein